MENTTTLRLILGDQLNHTHSWFKSVKSNIVYIMAEMRQETDYVTHHIQKVVAFFLAMRNFAKWLEKQGHRVIYIEIDAEGNPQNLEQIILETIKKTGATSFEYQLPDEFRLDVQLKKICKNLKIPSKATDTEHFYTTRDELATFFKGKKQLLMESFYRMMRQKHNILMHNGQPEGGKWNFDHINRKKWPGSPSIPKEKTFERNISSLLMQIQNAGVKTMGTIDENRFNWPVTREDCFALLKYFCNALLPHFGDFQDAMHTNEKFLFHSRLSFAMNIKLLSPKEVVQTVLQYYETHKKSVDISQVEGFIRQIIGWREYMRGIYWKEMPEYANLNKLGNYNKLPEFYWTGNTHMNCLRHAIGQSLTDAYAHHIQRLMVTGNFALLLHVHPDEVDAWYLGVYIDALQWVEITNTRGMSQFADGGLIATKPYISSANYINKMSNYCGSCRYNHQQRVGENACPFNSLYWNFLEDKKEHFKNNPRMSMMLSLLANIKTTELEAIKKRASEILQNPNAF